MTWENLLHYDPDHDLKSSDIADGIQCVARISRVVAFAVVVRRIGITVYLENDRLVNKAIAIFTQAHKTGKEGKGACLYSRSVGAHLEFFMKCWKHHLEIGQISISRDWNWN